MRWQEGGSDLDPELRGSGCVVPLLLMAAVTGVLVVFVYPEAREGLVGAAPVQIHVLLVAGAVNLGTLALAGRASPRPLVRAFTAFAAGTVRALTP